MTEAVLTLINRPEVTDGAAEWSSKLMEREDVRQAFAETFLSSCIENPEVQKTTADTAVEVLAKALEDEESLKNSKEHIAKVLSDPDVQQEAAGAVWKGLKKTFGDVGW